MDIFRNAWVKCLVTKPEILRPCLAPQGQQAAEESITAKTDDSTTSGMTLTVGHAGSAAL